MLVQTAAIVKVIWRRRGDIEDTYRQREAHLTLGVAMEVFKYVPDNLDVYSSGRSVYRLHILQREIPSKPSWILASGF